MKILYFSTNGETATNARASPPLHALSYYWYQCVIEFHGMRKSQDIASSI